MKQTIKLTESNLRNLIRETVKTVLKENWELDQLNYLRDKERGEYDGTNPRGGKFNIRDRVIVTKRNGETFEGVISDCDINDTTFDVQYDVEYKSNDGIRTMIGIPEEAIELI